MPEQALGGGKIDEAAVISRCQAGQLEEFGLLYDAYIRRIYDFIYYKTHHKETAEDLVSRTFMKALEKIQTFSLEKGTFQGWLYQIARNTVIDHYRTQKKDVNIEDVWDLKDNQDIARDLEAKMKVEEIKDYLAKLKPEQRDIIIMRVWQGLTYQEIAGITGKTEGSCKMVYSRAIQALRREMPITALFVLLAGW
jgi:RNA polymerase sigma-70 factor (ECF subfamily)